MKKWVILISMLVFYITFIGVYQFVFSGSEGDEPIHIPTMPKEDKNWVYGEIEFIHDVIDPRTYYLKLHDTPSNGLGVPEVYGGYSTTDVYAKVRLRGVQVPRALQERENRERPPLYLQQERLRWNRSMQYVWNLMQPNKVMKLSNFEVLENDKLLEADIQVLLGGEWLPLAVLMVNDLYAARDLDDVDFDFGSKELSPTNPNIPK